MRSFLNFPRIYNLFSRIIAGDTRAAYVERYIRPKEGDRILDLGCGPADILLNLPDVAYVGIDMNSAYIAHAERRFANRGTFLLTKVNREMVRRFSLADFDLVLATAVLHHLNDDEAMQLFEVARAVLKPGGRLITLDGCFVAGQSLITRFILSRDRGKYVRTKDAYLSIAQRTFKDVKASVHHDLIRIPYTHIIMECTA